MLLPTVSEAVWLFFGQGALILESLDDYVAGTNPVRVVDVFVDELDLGQLGLEGVVPAETGRPAVSERASHLAGGHPVVRQQLGQSGGLLRRQAREHVLQVGVRIMPVQAG